MRNSIIIAAVATLLIAIDGFSDQGLPPAISGVVDEVRQAISDLDHPDYCRRDAATEVLYRQGLVAISRLVETAEKGSTEASIRAFSVLQRLFRREDDATNEAIEAAFHRLKQSERLDVATRASRIIDGFSETRQRRSIVQFERLGGVVTYLDAEHGLNRNIAHLTLPREWTGGDVGLKYLTRIDEIRHNHTVLYIVRGVNLREESKLDLKAELPFMDFQPRGPARLGVGKQNQWGFEGCAISTVEKDSSAERAGLKPGDRILKIDGQDVDTFEDLIKIVGEKEPGERIPIVYVRNNEELTTDAVLLSWGKVPRSSDKPVPKLDAN